ncbi:hypothetical protein BH23PAT1_BH23PAT1_1020 [soil metagenome]
MGNMIDDFKKPLRRNGQDSRPYAAKIDAQEETVSEPVFRAPEEVAERELESITLPQSLNEPVNKRSPGKFNKLTRHLPNWSKKRWMLALALILMIGTGGAAWEALRSRSPADDGWKASVYKYEPKEPETVASRLTGVQISPELNKLPTTGVIMENSPDARPQSGLIDAGVVFEAISEGGITRFLAIYMETKPENLGPVRSIRPYFLDFLVPFNAPLAHVGGSAEALAQIRQQNIRDIDQMHNPGAYHRRNHRYAPHNMYTSRNALLDLQRKKGFSESKFEGFVRKAEKKAKTPNATSIDISLSSPLYNVHYDYNKENNSYARVMGGKPHTDEHSGKQIQPKVVVVLISPHSYRGIYSQYKVTGSGKAFIFQNGTVTEGKWEKKNRSSQFKFGDANGSPVGLNPGQTWVTLAGGRGMVSFK